MKIKALILLAAMSVSGSAIYAQSGINNPMTRAVLDVYERQLKEDPADYETWLNRANEYYKHNEYMRALNDVDNALKHIPVKDTDTRCVALLLRANIYTQTGRTEKALEDLNSVASIDPSNYVAIYQRANAHYSLGNYNDAKSDFNRLLRLNPRSAEALIGLSRISLKENNLGLANEYLEQAVNNDPNNPELYVRRATVRRDMGDDHGAVQDLILALATDSRNARATTMLVDYGNVNYAAVINGLTEAVMQAPNVGMYLYLRAVIAQAHYNYKAALSDYRTILDKNLYNYQGIYRSIAECQYAMAKFDDALMNVDRALDMDRNAGDAALLRTKILRALGRYDEAKTQAAATLAMLPNSTDALDEMGLVYVSLKDYKEAANLFGEATMNEITPNMQWCYMLRAWVLDKYLNQPVAATGFYGKVAELSREYAETYPARDMFAAFALLYTGETTEADKMVQVLMDANQSNPYLQYLGACYYSARDDEFDRALACATRALEAGYANLYDWMHNTDARVNVAPLRDDLRFLNLLQRYSHLWD